MAITDLPFGWPDYTAIQQGWQCPVCRRVWAPSVAMCNYCPAQPVASTGTHVFPGCSCGTAIPCTWHPDATIITTNHQGTVDFIAKGHLGTPCPRPKDGGMCGCDEDDDEPPKVCLSRECDCV